MWTVYRLTGNDEDYTNYKEPLNAAMPEMRKSKRSYEHKLACNANNDSKQSLFVYVMSKQTVRDKFGTLEDRRGNII